MADTTQHTAQKADRLPGAPPVPIIFHRSVRHVEVTAANDGTAFHKAVDVVDAMATAMGLDSPDVKQTATKWRITMRLGDGRDRTVVKIHVYQLKPGTLLLDWTHREGSREAAALWWRHLLAGLRPYVTGPPEVVPVTEGPPQASTVYTVPPLPGTQDE